MHKVVTTFPRVGETANKAISKFVDKKQADIFFRVTANFHFETKLPIKVELFDNTKIVRTFDKLTE